MRTPRMKRLSSAKGQFHDPSELYWVGEAQIDLCRLFGEHHRKTGKMQNCVLEHRLCTEDVSAHATHQPDLRSSLAMGDFHRQINHWPSQMSGHSNWGSTANDNLQSGWDPNDRKREARGMLTGGECISNAVAAGNGAIGERGWKGRHLGRSRASLVPGPRVYMRTSKLRQKKYRIKC